MPSLLNIAWIAAEIGEVLLALRIVQKGQIRRYLPLFVFLLYDLLKGAILGALSMLGYGNRTVAFGEAWMVIEPIYWVLLIWLVLSAYHAVFDCYPERIADPRRGQFRRRMLLILSIGVSIGAAAAIYPQRTLKWALLKPLNGFALAEQFVFLAAGVLLLLTWAYFRTVFGALDRRSAGFRYHWNTLTAYLGIKGAGIAAIVLLSVSPALCQNINILVMAGSAGCYVAWWFALGREREWVYTGPRFTPAEARRIAVDAENLAGVLDRTGEILRPAESKGRSASA